MEASTYLRTAQILPFISGPISFLSSVYILWYILWKRRCRDLMINPKEHFVLGMALLDACASFGASFSTKPYDHSLAACEAQGFLVQLGSGVPLYNMALAVYYVLSVIWHVSDKRVLKWMVPTVHIFIVGLILTSAVIALHLNLYNPDGVLGCWISDAPRDVQELCLSGQNQFCGRGINGGLYQLRFMAYHCATSWIVVLLSMITLTVVVRRTESRSVRWADQWNQTGRRRQHPRMPLTQRTTETGVLYSLVFLFVFTPVIVTGTPLRKIDGLYKCMVVLLALFTPLQGFFNLLIYTSPIWLKKLHDIFDERRQLFCYCCDPCLPLRFLAPAQQDDTVEITQCTQPIPSSSSLTGASGGRHLTSSVVVDPDLLFGQSSTTKDDHALRNLRSSMFRVSSSAAVLKGIHGVVEVDDDDEDEVDFLDEPKENSRTSTTTDQVFSITHSSQQNHADCMDDNDER